MKILNITLLLVITLSIISCENEKEERKIVPNKVKNHGVLLRNPIDIDGNVDSSILPIITFEEDVYNFGEVSEGDIVTHEFNFTNTGKAKLVITNVRAACGCTTPEWPNEPIEPGESNSIKVEFNSKGRSGHQKKPITISSNTIPSEHKLRLVGTVLNN